MNGYTPWELATLKARYHSKDVQHKGYLTLADVTRIWRELGDEMLDAEARSRRVFEAIDVNRDGHVTFDELVDYLARSTTPDAVALRQYFFKTEASAATGATVGLLLMLKTKGVVAMGAFFADPIRLFRDYYVEYTTSIRAHQAAAGTANSSGLWQAWRRVGVYAGCFWFIFAVCLDSAVGVTMFLTYAHARARLANEYRTRYITGAAASRPFTVAEHLGFEWTAGCAAGFVSGALEIPAQAAAASHLRPSKFAASMRHFGFKFSHRLLRSSTSHGAFFSSFHASRSAIDGVFFNSGVAERTSFRSAVVTATAGCCAGAGYRLFAVPIENWSSYVRHKGAAAWRAEPMKRQLLFRGLPASLALTMPITGVIFLGYEYALMTL